MVHYWKEFETKKTVIRLGLLFPSLAFIAYIIFLTGVSDSKVPSNKYLLENLNIQTTNKNVPLYYWKDKIYSGQFYSNGKAQVVKNELELDSVLNLNKKMYFAIPRKEENEISENIKSRLILSQSNFKTLIFESK
jgi:hypothetical protein